MSTSAVKLAAVVAITAPCRPYAGKQHEIERDVDHQADEQGHAAQPGLFGAPQIVLGDGDRAEPGAIDERQRQLFESFAELAAQNRVEQERGKDQRHDRRGKQRQIERFEHRVQARGHFSPPAQFPIVTQMRA